MNPTLSGPAGRRTMSLRRWSVGNCLVERKGSQWVSCSFSPALQVLEESCVMVRPWSLRRTLHRPPLTLLRRTGVGLGRRTRRADCGGRIGHTGLVRCIGFSADDISRSCDAVSVWCSEGDGFHARRWAPRKEMGSTHAWGARLLTLTDGRSILIQSSTLNHANLPGWWWQKKAGAVAKRSYGEDGRPDVPFPTAKPTPAFGQSPTEPPDRTAPDASILLCYQNH